MVARLRNRQRRCGRDRRHHRHIGNHRLLHQFKTAPRGQHDKPGARIDPGLRQRADQLVKRVVPPDIFAQTADRAIDIAERSGMRRARHPAQHLVIAQNLGAHGAGTLWPVGFCGDDGEGFELLKALRAVPGASLDHFLRTPDRRTFTYTKPLLHSPPKAPVELSRLDIKNWVPTPAEIENQLGLALRNLGPELDALIVMDQAGVPGAGVISPAILHAVHELTLAHPKLVVLADSRHGLGRFPPLIFKMNAAEFLAFTHRGESVCHPLGDKRAEPREVLVEEILAGAERIAATGGRPVFITLAERGIVGAAPGGPAIHVAALPVRGEIDIVGAGDAVTAALTLALAAGAQLDEAMTLAQAAASVVIHQLGTTGTARGLELRALLFP